MSNGLNVRGTGRGSGNQITDEERGLLSPGSTTSSKQASTKESAGRQPPSPGGIGSRSRPHSREQTESRVQSEIRSLRPRIPALYNLYRFILFDSIFWDPPYDHEFHDFRGTVMEGWELNYYFTGMALAHHADVWDGAASTIYIWSFVQESFIHIISRRSGGFSLDNQMNDRMWWAAQVGFREEYNRMARRPVPAPPPLFPMP